MSLPRPTSLIGRGGELAQLDAEITSNRLVTVTGVGGVGKTRLVAELLAEHLDGECIVVELAPVEPGGVASTLGAALGYRADVVDERGLSELLRSTTSVLVLDNCEHVVAEVRSLVRRLLDGCPGIRVLTTTRTRLELPEERVITLAPLPIGAGDGPAVQLFVDRLRRMHPEFDSSGREHVLAEVCARLDGVPLALELAASRAAVFGVEALAERLHAPLDVLVSTSDQSGRHATLGNVIEWSVDLLDPPARSLLAALSVFRGTFDLDAADQVGSAVGERPAAALVGQLLDTSLVSPVGESGRFRLLEMIRHFAADELEALSRRDAVRRAHAMWVAGELQDVAAGSAGPLESDTSSRLDRLRVEIEAALDWAGGVGDVDAITAIAAPLATPLLYRPDRELVLAVLGAARSGEVSTDVPPELLAAGARAAFLHGDLAQVERLAHMAVDLADDRPAARHRAAHALGVVRLYQGRFEESRRWFERVTDDEQASLVDRVDSLGGLGLALCYLRQQSRATDVASRLRALAEVIDSDTYRAFGHYMSAEISLADGNIDAAVAGLDEASEVAWSVGAGFVWGIASTVLAAVLVRHRPHDEARRHLPLLIERWRRTTTWPQLWTTLRIVAELVKAAGHAEVALLVLEAADRDSASPTPVGDDAERVAMLRAELEAELGAPRVSGVVAAAAALDRVTVLDRAVEALAS